MAAAELHLTRAIALAETEWKVSIAFWTALLLSGVSFISFTNNSSLPMVLYIVHSDELFLVPYLLAAMVFVFGFSVNQARSIVEERTRYRHCQNMAARHLGIAYEIPADPAATIRVVATSRVWAVKLLSTFLFVTGIWASSQWLAHGKINALAGRRQPAICAFLQCDGNPYGSPSLERGTTIWLIALAFTVFFALRAARRDGR